MKRRLSLPILCAMVLSCAAPTAFGQNQSLGASTLSQSAAPDAAKPAQGADAKSMDSTTTFSRGGIRPLFVDVLAARGLRKTTTGVMSRPLSRTSPSSAASGRFAPSSVAKVTTEVNTDDPSSGVSTLPLWTFRLRSSRDGQNYLGTMVGRSPFNDPGGSKIPTEVIPLVIKTKNVAVSFDPKTGIVTTKPGNTTLDPTKADDVCLSPPNDVPIQLVSGSPIFTSASFSFGGTFVGNTQYSDAFQRANFWNVLGENRDQYHVRLKPVQFLDPIVLDVPSVYGLAITDPLFFGPPAFCAPLGIVDINWFDTYLTGTLIPALARRGVNPTNFPIFLVYNTVWAAPVANLFTCCILGYHGTTGFPIPTQTYSPADFDTTQAISNAAGSTAGFSDSAILSHEVDEWMNDPMISNPSPPWGNTGQVQGFCQANLEVGDPLTGTVIQSVTMPNGFTYHLQELAFFSWFFGAPSTGVNGWFSDNGTFTMDAGPPCF